MVLSLYDLLCRLNDYADGQSQADETLRQLTANTKFNMILKWVPFPKITFNCSPLSPAYFFSTSSCLLSSSCFFRFSRWNLSGSLIPRVSCSRILFSAASICCLLFISYSSKMILNKFQR